MKNKQDYSQIPRYIYWHLYNEIYSLLKEKTFVDVGACDGEIYTNTLRLLLDGWHGIYIEPNPISFNKLKKNCKIWEKQKNKISYDLHECAVGNFSGEIDFYINEEFSSIKKETQFFKNHNKTPDNIVRVKITTLNELLKDIKKFNLLSIDVEEYEIETLQGYDISQHFPEVVIIETHEKNPNYNKDISNFCEKYFLKYGYKNWFSNYINTIYLIDEIYNNTKKFL